MSNPLLEKLEQQKTAGGTAPSTQPAAANTRRNPLLDKLEQRNRLSPEERFQQDSIAKAEAFWADATPASGSEELPEWTSQKRPPA